MRKVTVIIKGASLKDDGLEVRGEVCGEDLTCLLPSAWLPNISKLEARNLAAERLYIAWLASGSWTLNGEVEVIV